MNEVWSLHEKQLVVESAHLKDEDAAKKLSELLNREISVHSYRKQRQKLGIKKGHGRGKSIILKGESTHATKSNESRGNSTG